MLAVSGSGGRIAVSGLVGRRGTASRRHGCCGRTWRSADGAARGRWVRDRMLLRAVLDGYESLLMRGRYPVRSSRCVSRRAEST
jgi:hypothetical protein